MSDIFRLGCACILFLAVAGYTQAQGRLRATAAPATAAPAPAAPPPGTSPSLQKPTAPSNVTVTFISNTEVDLSWTASTETGGTIAKYLIKRVQQGKNPATLSSSTTSYSDTDLTGGTVYTYQVIAVDSTQQRSSASPATPIAVTTTAFTCYLFPVRPGCVIFPSPADESLKNDKSLKKASKQNNINSFYQTYGPLSFFNQIKSIYNGASGSATVSADIATMNFGNGMQVTVGTNVQAGSSGATTASSGTVPTLSANGAGQATQNILYGGTFFVSELYPVAAVWGSSLGSAGGFGLYIDLIGKEGADIQNFKSGTNVSVTAPPFHGSAQMEGYLQYNSINFVPGTQNFVGALFVGGSYGYSYMSHAYARDYGFSQVSNGVGQISFGVLINNVAKISVSRGFGPSQTYIDSTTLAQTTVDNFKSWSFGITYQSPPPTPAASNKP